MADAARGVAYLERVRSQVISGDSIDWNKYLKPDDHARIVPAEVLAEKGKARLLLGVDASEGLSLPWPKTEGKVLIRPGKLCIWAGWTHHGKTQMVKQVMLHAVSKSEKPLIASMEEEIVDVWTDLAVMACGRSDPSPRNIDRFVEFVRGNLWLYDQQGTVGSNRLQAVIRYAAQELKVTQVVVDSLMMLAIDRDDYEAQSKFVRDLKTTAKDTGVTVHLVAHMRKRDGKTGDNAIGSIHDISGGHEIASVADYVFIPWRNKDQGAAEPCILKIEKQRGRVNWLGNVGLGYHLDSRQFIEDAPVRFWDDTQDF